MQSHSGPANPSPRRASKLYRIHPPIQKEQGQRPRQPLTQLKRQSSPSKASPTSKLVSTLVRGVYVLGQWSTAKRRLAALPFLPFSLSLSLSLSLIMFLCRALVYSSATAVRGFFLVRPLTHRSQLPTRRCWFFFSLPPTCSLCRFLSFFLFSVSFVMSIPRTTTHSSVVA